jgi:hypothetical protein
MNGLIIEVYRSKDTTGNDSDCTNGGISATFDRLTLIGKGISGPFAPTPERPAVTMITRTICGEEYKHIVPCDENAQPLPGWYMFGGNYGVTSDSRFPHRYPLAIHDRQEPYNA